jgi:uncharacterized protein (TIGR03663 family)
MAIAEPATLPQAAAQGVRPAAEADIDELVRGPRLEHLAYLALLLIALLAHLWVLGSRAMHHDETLHAFYSWELYSGRGYVHDPLMHGPLLYFLSALSYYLFSDSETTARLAAALFGTALVGMPYLLRRELGRGAALLAAGYLLISPAFLYVGRFLRHDIFAVAFELLTFIGVVRYASTRQPAYLYLAAGSFALMVTTMETSYLYAVIFLPVLAALLLWRVWRPGLALLGGLALVVALLLFVLPGEAEKDAQNNALRDEAGQMRYTPGPLGWRPLETSDNAFALQVRNRPDDDLFAYLGDIAPFFVHPSVLLAIGLGLAALGSLAWMVWLRRGRDGLTAWQRVTASGDSLALGFASLAQDRRWLWALGLFGAIYGLLYTAFFTNPLGLLTGTTGSLLYWLAQHEVERGGQPWYYYLVLMAVYEPLLLLWGAIGLATAGGLGWSLLGRQGKADDAAPGTQSLALPLVLAWWSLAALFLYSWAGEKMPWLTVHIYLPLTLLGAWAMARHLPRFLISPADPFGPREQAAVDWRSLWMYLAGALTIVGLGFVLLSNHAGEQGAAEGLAFVVLLVLVLLGGVLSVVAALTNGWRWSLGALALAASLAMGLYTLRASWQLSFRHADTPREIMIFVQTSPDVARVIERLEQASIRRTGRLDMPVIYDNETIWLWYMRDFRRATNSGPALAGPPDPEVMAVLLLEENMSEANRSYLRGFQLQRYPLRWWFPESETYRLGDGWANAPLEQTSLLGRALRAPFDNTTISQLWQFLIYRTPPGTLGSTDFYIAVRPELAAEIGLGTGGATQP